MGERIHRLTHLVNKLDGTLSLLSDDETVGVPTARHSLLPHVAHNEQFDALIDKTGFSTPQGRDGKHAEPFYVLWRRLGL